MVSNPSAAAALLGKIEQTEIFEIDWALQFTAAPKAISYMADCFVAITPEIRTLLWSALPDRYTASSK